MAETGLGRGVEWSKRDLGSRLRDVRQISQGRVVGACGSGHLCDQAIQDHKRSGIIQSKNSSVAQYKGGGWGGGVVDDREKSRKHLTVGWG